MKPTAIVYTSNTGFTARYAALLSEETGLPAYSIKDAGKNLAKGVSYQPGAFRKCLLPAEAITCQTAVHLLDNGAVDLFRQTEATGIYPDGLRQ